MDEATSATDEGLEHALYGLLRSQLPDCMTVSVGHRSTLDAFHDLGVSLDGRSGWTMSGMPTPPLAAASGQAARRSTDPPAGPHPPNRDCRPPIAPSPDLRLIYPVPQRE